jgi:glutathione S-transferase
MNDVITFYHNPMSRGRIAHWMLEESGAKYEVKLLRFDLGEHKRAEYLAINPMGKIPAIVHRGTVVTECAAICTYLGDAFPAAKLAPSLDDPRRGTYLRWLFFAAGCVEPAVLDHMMPRAAPAQRTALGYGSYEDTLNALEKAIAPGPFILGEWFTAADVYIASQIGWGMMMKSIEPRPAFQAYVKRCAERPAYLRFTEQVDTLAEQVRKMA